MKEFNCTFKILKVISSFEFSIKLLNLQEHERNVSPYTTQNGLPGMDSRTLFSRTTIYLLKQDKMSIKISLTGKWFSQICSRTAILIQKKHLKSSVCWSGESMDTACHHTQRICIWVLFLWGFLSVHDSNVVLYDKWQLVLSSCHALRWSYCFKWSCLSLSFTAYHLIPLHYCSMKADPKCFVLSLD